MANHCIDDVTVSGLSLRAGSPSFTLTPGAGPLVIPAQSTATFTVSFTPQAGAPAEDIVFVEMAKPVQGGGRSPCGDRPLVFSWRLARAVFRGLLNNQR